MSLWRRLRVFVERHYYRRFICEVCEEYDDPGCLARAERAEANAREARRERDHEADVADKLAEWLIEEDDREGWWTVESLRRLAEDRLEREREAENDRYMEHGQPGGRA